MSSQTDDVVYEFEAGRKTIRARVTHFRGRAFLDLRPFYEPEPGMPLAPTPKGISLPIEYLDDLREAVDALATAVAQAPKKAARRCAA